VSEKRGGCLSRLFKLGVALFLFAVLMKFLSTRSGTLPDAPSASVPPVDERQKRIDDAAAESKKMAAEWRAEQKPIPGVKASDVTNIATQQGFTLKKRPADKPQEWQCSKESTYGILTMDCFGHSEESIYSISIVAGAAAGWDKEIRADAAEFFPVAVGQLKIDGVDATEAATWVSENLGNDVKRQFGPCEFELSRGTGFGLNITLKK
jgi:hypothetical protein